MFSTAHSESNAELPSLPLSFSSTTKAPDNEMAYTLLRFAWTYGHHTNLVLSKVVLTPRSWSLSLIVAVRVHVLLIRERAIDTAASSWGSGRH